MKKVDLNIIRENIKDYAGKKIKVGGWVRSVRDSKSFGFVDLNDGTTFKAFKLF